MSRDEQQELFQRETRIEAAQEMVHRSWVLIGQELRAIRERKLYRATHATFEDYCQQRWGFTPQRAGQLIAAEGVVRNLEQPDWASTEEIETTVSIFTPPPSENHVRPLVNLTPTQQREVWHEVEATAPEGKITERHGWQTVSSSPVPCPLET